MKKLLIFLSIMVFLNCTSTYIEEVVSKQSQVFELDGAKFEIQENSVKESTLVRIEKKKISKRNYGSGFNILGESFIIQPETLFFEKPVLFSCPVGINDAALGAKIGKGFVPIASSMVQGETLRAQIWHGGEYYVITRPEEYGIINASDSEEAMLIVSDIYVSDYLEDFKTSLKRGGYNLPIWIFVYSNKNTIEENAYFLAEELSNLHDRYGDFRLDVVSFGIGGLITHRYVADTTLYKKDFSTVIIAVGTPFHGSKFADFDGIRKGRSPYRFFFIDGLGSNAKEIEPESDFILWLKRNKGLPGGYYYDKIEENKNFASLSGKSTFGRKLAEEFDGDGLVSVSSTMLTPIEPEPYDMDHFRLFEDDGMHKIIGEFVQLYRNFNWPMVFKNVWDGEEEFSKVTEIWEKEINLILHKKIDFETLLEFNNNMLKSAPKHAILITNGDFDTYPAWFLQERGVRDDVLIVNRSLLNLKDNVRFLQKRGLPLEITQDELDNIEHHKDDNGRIVTISDQLIKILLKQSERPVVFSTTVYEPHRYGYPLQLRGLVYEIGEVDVDVEKTSELLHKVLSFDKLFSVPITFLSRHNQNLSKNYAACAFQLANALREQGKYEEALDEIEFAMKFSDEPVFYYNKALVYFETGDKYIADSIFRNLIDMKNVDIEMKKRIAQSYYDNNMKEAAIKVLAECLKTQPDDKEIIELIKEYQEE